MKMKKLLSLFTFAAAAAVAPTMAQASGDIVDIRVMDMPGKRFGDRAAASGEACSPDNPVVAGEEIYIRVRMLVRNAAVVIKGGKDPQTWGFADGVEPKTVLDQPMLGLRIGERNCWAVYSASNADGTRFSGDLHYDDAGVATEEFRYFTDLYFKYTVQPGDMGLPVKLLKKDLSPADEVSGDSNEYAFGNVNCISQKFKLCDTAGTAADLYRRSELMDFDWPRPTTEELKDYSLIREGLYVKTVDFDNTYADLENNIWRDVNRAGVKGSDATVVITTGSKAPQPMVIYVWTTNETVVMPAVGMSGKSINPMKIGSKTYNVLQVQLSPDEGDGKSARFVLKATATSEIGQTAEVFMSPNPTLTDAVGTLARTTVSRWVRVVKDDPPGVSLRFDGVTPKTVTAGADYNTPATRLVVRIENDDPARAKPVKVKLNALVTDDAAHATLTKIYNSKYLWLSTSDSGFDAESEKVEYVEIPAGSSSVEYFVYALGASEKTEKKGILFTPEVVEGSGYETVGLTDQPTARLNICRLGEEGIKIAKTEPASGDITMAKGAGEKKRFKVTFADSWKNMFGEDDGDAIYTVELVGTEGDDEGRVFATKSEVSYKSAGYVQCDLTLEDDVIQKSAGYPVALVVTSPDGSTSEPVPFHLVVVGGKQVEIALAPGFTSMTVGEGDTIEVNLGLNREADTDDKFIFLKGLQEVDGTRFDSTLKTVGAQLGSDYQHVDGTRAIRLLDDDTKNGGGVVNIRAFVGDTFDDPTDVDKAWSEGKLNITVTNKPPVVRSLNIAGTPVTFMNDNNTVLEGTVPMGIDKTFKIMTIDEPSEADREHLSALWSIDGTDYEMKDTTLEGCMATHAFAAKTAQGAKGQLIELRLKDKDMLDYPAEPSFRCWVKVSAKPFISITTSAIGGVLNETDANVAMVSVALSEPASTELSVILKVQAPATGIFKLRESEGSVKLVERKDGYDYYRLTFKSGAEKLILISEMDGTNDTLAGIDMSATVETEGWETYYDAGSLVPPVRVQNVPPEIIRPTASEEAYTNMNASANTPYSIFYGAKDVKADLDAGITVEIRLDGKTVKNDTLFDTTVKEHKVEFDAPGPHVVEIVFTDKDQMNSRSTLNFFVSQNKVLKLSAHGPATKMASSGGYSAKYQGAKGLGAGRVYAGENGPQKVVSFVHTYSFGLLQSSIMAYAYAYKADVTKPDDGTLPGYDQAIDKNGNWSQDATIGEFYNYALDNYTPDTKHKGFQGLDSFVYGWACNNSQASKNSDSGTEEFMLDFGETGSISIPLPDAEENGSSSGSGNDSQLQPLPIQYWEAIFSSELLKSDNMGDMNGDGVPDLYLQLYKFDILDATGKLVGDDLRDVNFTSDENPVPYCAEGDYLPSTERAVYGELIPSLPETWMKTGEEFTPVLKIRGFPEGYLLTDSVSKPSALNDAPHLVGLADVADRVYTNPKNDTDEVQSTLSYVEWLAWCEFAAANGWDPADETHWKSWSPENPTDPTKADTDRDGLTDGYEYWMWYMAHVGWIENYGTANEVHKRLTGRRYDPRNPGEGTLITSDEIARLFNPNSPMGAKERDTDNDGLPDALEFEIGTNPVDFDTDGDGLPDGWEIIMGGCNPLLQVSYTHGINDAERNFDGDAMAISSYELEKVVLPSPADPEHAHRWTFAVLKDNGDSDGVQWYATTAEPTLADVRTIAAASWWKVTVDGVDYLVESEKKPALVNDKRLASDIKAYTLVECEVPEVEEEATVELVRGYPVRFCSGTLVTVSEGDADVKVKKLAEPIAETDANACWIYGKSRTGLVDAKFGQVSETAADYGCLALGRQAAVGADELCAVPSQDRDVAFLHYLCYQEFGFDPRTAWSAESPLASRWEMSIDGEGVSGVLSSRQGGYAGLPTRTRAYTAYDEFLVYSFFVNNGFASDGGIFYRADAAPNVLAEKWGMYTTNPMGPGEVINGNESGEETTGYYWGRDSDQGADTDGDGVPDGWELYIMAGPKKDGAYVFAPPYSGFKTAFDGMAPKSYWSPFVPEANSAETANPVYTMASGVVDTLTELREFSGTDSCAHYAGGTVPYSKTILLRTAQVAGANNLYRVDDSKWLNKFFPTDPWNNDTDGDGLVDSAEAGNFVYGDPADNGKRWTIPGAGLNPCTVDTDLDGLPDLWEAQFKGSVVYSGEDAIYAPDASGNQGNPLQGYVDGMDGTVKDATTYPNNGVSNDSGSSGCVNRDYDHDGLENWQEYLTGTMRCWRYDDPVTPFTAFDKAMYFETKVEKDEESGEEKTTVAFNAEYAAKNLKAAGLLEADDVNEFWYKTLIDASSPAYNPHLVMGTSSGAQYFSRIENTWDIAYYDKTLGASFATGAYYWFPNRIDGNALAVTWGQRWAEDLGIDPKELAKNYSYVPHKYPSCSPIDPDSDHDGMDDYYELFHGMNPLLGKSGVVGNWLSVGGRGGIAMNTTGFDLVYDAMYATGMIVAQAWGEKGDDKNFWQRLVASEGYAGKKPRGTGFDFEVYPWLSGLAEADPDGDGTMNQEESIMGSVAPETAFHHSDPTPLWMTDSSYSNSFTRLFYRLPLRTDDIDVPTRFTYDEVEYKTCNYAGILGGVLGAYKPDLWSLTAADKMNFIASFEENEGFDTDHDGLSDSDETAGKYRGKTDSTNFDSPRRRQAMYFQGWEADKKRGSLLQTMPFVKEKHPLIGMEYPDDMSFLHYTVECWVKAETLDDATVIERANWMAETNPGDEEFLRCNFSLGIKGGKWYTKYDYNDTTKRKVELASVIPATTEWTHLAATYDGVALVLYVNGQSQGSQTSGAQPAYGSGAAWVRSWADVNGTHYSWSDKYGKGEQTYWKDDEYPLNAIVLGASFKTIAGGAKDGKALDVTQGVGWSAYENFFKGYVDEVRVWDGARTAGEIRQAMGKRFTAEDIEANRSAFYEEWSKGGANDDYRGRYAKDENGNAYRLPAELRYHWAFDSVLGAISEDLVAKAPQGFDFKGTPSDEIKNKDGRAILSRPEGYEIAWWKTILDGYTDTVYGHKAWIEWVPNTVTHMPRFDGTTLDSAYWSEDFKGSQAGVYKFARAAEPVSRWTQYVRNGLSGAAENSYMTMSTRHYLMDATDKASGSTFLKPYSFTARHLNQTGDDLLPLGGVYVKQLVDMWDGQGASSNWEIGSGNVDSADGLPFWWIEYAKDEYNSPDEPMWDTLVTWPEHTKENRTVMTAGEAYMRDLARGYVSNEAGDYIDEDFIKSGEFAQTYDMDGNGIPDWWEELYGLSGVDPFADTDNDGLPNYVEYLLSEVFEFKGVRFSPIDPRSVDSYTPDYFYKVGELYAGEIFTDHDLVDDAWEDQYEKSYSSRLVWDAYADADSDGWSNRSENRYSKQCMPIQADKQSHFSAADGRVADYPIPTIELTLNYNGGFADTVRTAPIVVKVTRDPLAAADADATFKIGEVADDKAGTGTASTEQTDKTIASYTRTLGKWSNRHALGTLTPGYINKDSVALEFCFDPDSVIYTWEIKNLSYDSWYTLFEEWTIKRGSRVAYDGDRRKYGEENIHLLTRDTGYKTFESVELRTDAESSVATWVLTQTGLEFGTLDLTSGKFDINLGAFAGLYVVDSSNANDRVSLEDQTFRIAYAVNAPTTLPRTLYLGEANTGYVKEGKNQITAFVDTDGNGAYTPGEPYGIANDVEISWKGTKATIELTETSPVTPRITLWGGSSESSGGSSSSGKEGGSTVAADRIRTVDEIYTEIKESIYAQNLPPKALSNALENLSWMQSNVIATPEIKANQDIHVRVVRWLVDGNPVWLCGVEPRVVYDQVLNSSVAKTLTEGDFLNDGAFDLDWQYLQSEVVQAPGVRAMRLDVTEVDYLVVIGDGVTAFMGRDDTNNVVKALSQVVARKFGTSRVTPQIVSPSATAGQVVREASPTFKWTVSEPGISGYTAFKVQVANAAGKVVFDSGVQPAPARDANGTYVWKAPLYVGDKTAQGEIYGNDAIYSWKVSMYNSKYKTDSFSTAGTYMQATQTNGLDYGSARVAVRYYGPTKSYEKATIRVRAYESPDFTGTPVAAGYVALPSDAETGVGVSGKPLDKANCTLIGLPKGTYYLHAFIDSNGNGVCDKWESMGYLCDRSGNTVDWLNPVGIKFDDKIGFGDIATIYIEDADTDGDSLPDAWEFATNGDLTTQGVAGASVTAAGEFVANEALTGKLKVLAGKGIGGGIAGEIEYILGSSKAFAALVSGYEPSELEPDVTLKIAGFAFDAATQSVKIDFDASVTKGQEVVNTIYTIRSGDTLRIQVYHKDNLADAWEKVGPVQSFTVTKDAVNGSMSVPMEGIDTKSGFFTVGIER